MKIATVTLESVSPYSQSREYASEVEKLDRETPAAYDERTWRNHCHVAKDGTGRVEIPPMSFKMGLDTAASMLGMKIPGKGQSTYTKFFLSGVLVMEPLILDVKPDDLPCDRIYANADGKRGSGKRVWRKYPRIDKWSGEVAYTILADEITPQIFEDHLKQAGGFVGIGRFRPQSGGFYGRYKPVSIAWS